KVQDGLLRSISADESLDTPAVRGVRHAAPVPACRTSAQERTLTCLLADRSWLLPDAWGTTGRIWWIILTFQPTSGTASHRAENRMASGNGSQRANASRSCSSRCARSTVQTLWSR